jgi:hypothetical protein
VGKQVTELLPIPESSREITISPRSPLQRQQDAILFMPSLSNQIYQIHLDKSVLKYQLDFGKYWPNEDYLEKEKNNHPLKIAQNLAKNGYAAFLNYLDTKKVLHVNFEQEGKRFSFFYNKDSGQTLLFYNSNRNISQPLAATGTSFVSADYTEDQNPVLIFYELQW